jgi:hypothetical protein
VPRISAVGPSMGSGVFSDVVEAQSGQGPVALPESSFESIRLLDLEQTSERTDATRTRGKSGDGTRGGDLRRVW